MNGGERGSSIGLEDDKKLTDHRLNWREMERRLISEALLKTRGNRTRAAKLLGWGRSTLWRKMKQHNLM